MPGRTSVPGRREPVREAMPLQTAPPSVLSSGPNVTASMVPLSPPSKLVLGVVNEASDTAAAAQPMPRESLPPAATASAYPVAVPIAPQYAATYFPPSPPSTVGQGGSEEGDVEARPHDDHSVVASDSFSLARRSNDCIMQQPSTTGLTISRRAKAAAGNLRDNPVVWNLQNTPQQTLSHYARSSSILTTSSYTFERSTQDFFRSIMPEFSIEREGEQALGLTEDANIDILCPGWQGAVLDRAHLCGSRTLYAVLSSRDVANDSDRLRNNLLILLDLATERLACSSCIIGLDKNVLGEVEVKATLHGLCYVGGTLLSPHTAEAGLHLPLPAFLHRNSVLVAIEL